MYACRALLILTTVLLSACVSITEVSDRRMSCASNQANCSQQFRVNFRHGLGMRTPSANVRFTTSQALSGTFSSETFELQQDDSSDPPTRYQYQGSWSDRQAFGWCPRTVRYEAKGRFLGIFPDTDTESIVIPGEVERVEVFTDNFVTMRSQILNASTVTVGPLSADRGITVFSAYDDNFTVNSATLTCSGGQDCATMPNAPVQNIALGPTPVTMSCGGLYGAQFQCTTAAKNAGEGGEISLNTTRGNFVVQFVCQPSPGA